MFRCTKRRIYFILPLTILFVLTSCKQYRTDYIYNSNTDTFYKFHIESIWFLRAQTVCEMEGANLIEFTSEEDISQVHGMFKEYPDIGDEIWIGIDGKDHELAEEQSFINLDDTATERVLIQNYEYRTKNCDIMTREGNIKSLPCFRQLPFVCKVTAQDAIFNDRCMVYGKDYHYYENEGSCYMVSQIGISWDEAYAECQAAGAHLLVLNSETEWQIIQNLMKTLYNHILLQECLFYVGIRAENKSPIVFKTIFNQTLEAAGYNLWSSGQPNIKKSTEYCATVKAGNGMYNNVDCTRNLGFICESEVKNT